MQKIAYLISFFCFALNTGFAQAKFNDLTMNNYKGKVKTITEVTGTVAWGTDTRGYDSTIVYYNKNGNMERFLVWGLDEESDFHQKQTYKYSNKNTIAINRTAVFKSKPPKKDRIIKTTSEKKWLNDSTIILNSYDDKKALVLEKITYLDKSGKMKKDRFKRIINGEVFRYTESEYFFNAAKNQQISITTNLLLENEKKDTITTLYSKFDKFNNPTEATVIGEKTNTIQRAIYTYYDDKRAAISEAAEGSVKFQKDYKPNYCETNNDTFYNPYFGFSLKLPTTWTIQSKEAIAAGYDKSKNRIADVLPNGILQKGINPDWNEATLLVVSKYKNLGDTIFNPNITIVFEDVSYRYKNGYAYLLSVKNVMQKSKLKNQVVDSLITNQFYGSYGFSALHNVVDITLENKKPIQVHQVMNSIVLKNNTRFR
jgi:hypothetical protein